MILWRTSFLLVLPIGIASLLACCFLQGSEPKSETRGADSLKLVLWVSHARPNSGETVELRFTVENTHSKTVVIRSEEKPVMDIEIYHGARINRTTLYWSDGKEITPEMQKLELAPGESKTIEMTWVPEEGSYTAWAGGLLLREPGHDYVPVDLCVNGCAKP